MNLRICVNLLLAKYNSMLNSDVRSMLPVSHGFGLYDENRMTKYLDNPFKLFIESLRDDNKLFGEVSILQKNIARSRVVCKAKSEKSKAIVIKWCNIHAPCTFNFNGSMEMERYMHGVVAAKLGGIIPEMAFEGEMFFATEFVEGKSLSYFLKESIDENVVLILKKLLKGLDQLFHITKRSSFDAKIFNQILIRNHDYMRQIGTTPLIRNTFNILSKTRDFDAEYQSLMIRAGEIFSGRDSPWPTSICLHDLDLQNILFDENMGKVWVVDTEDAYNGIFIFDLAWLSSRIYLANNPLHYYGLCNSIILKSIKTLDSVDAGSSIKLYKTLTAMYLLIGIMNPSVSMPFLKSDNKFFTFSTSKDKSVKGNDWTEQILCIVDSLVENIN